MFKWHYECSHEFDVPIQKVWEFGVEPTNWPQWEEQFESCQAEGALKTGSIVKAKIKTRIPGEFFVALLITGIRPYNEIRFSVKLPLFFTQENTVTLQEMSTDKTFLTLKICLKGIFVPLARLLYFKRLERTAKKQFNLFLEAIKKT